MKSYQVIRTHVSPYQSQDFISREEGLVSALDRYNYRTLETFNSTEDSILLTNTHTRLKELPPDLLKKTKLIIHPNSGYDHFTDDHALWGNIPVVIGHSIRAQAVAEYTLGALFEGLLELPQHISWHQERSWKRTLLKDTNVCIFGYGHIGKIISDTLKVLGVRVTIVDPYKNDCLQDWKSAHISGARAIIVAASLNKITHHMFNEDFFNSLGNEVLFINAARGKLVDEKALKAYLLTHPDSFAFLDVFEEEPFGEDWHGFPQVWKTSHIAGVEKNLDQKILDFEIDVLKDFQNLHEAEFLNKYKEELLQNKWIKGVLI